jgi:hypothetical protein
MSAETIARKWHDQFLRSDPIDHSAAEAAVQHAYRCAGIPPPERFLWTASPIEAVWAVLVLVGKTDGYNHAVLESIERRKAGKAKVAETRASVAKQLGISEDALKGHFGKPFYVAEGSSPLGKALTKDSIDSWMARAEAGDDYLAVHKLGPFKQLHDLEQALHFEGYQVRNGSMQGSLYKQALTAVGGEDIAIVGGRSAQHRLYGSFAYIEVALDEALAEAGKFQPTELQQAMRSAYEACGLWWPCHQGVVFSERPIAAELTPEGPQMEWADGFTLGGKPATRSVPAPTSPPVPAAPKTAKFDPTQSDGPYLKRYLAGEHEQVWSDLVALGTAALTSADAAAVAHETMRRVAQNVGTIAERLRRIDYRFVYPGSEGGFFGFGKAKAHDPHVPPSAGSAKLIGELEELVGGPIPLSLRAFFEIVGEINFNGSHPVIAPADSDVTPDPLMVCSVEDALAMADGMDPEDGDPARIEFAPDALHKANVSGGGPYFIDVPAETADAMVQDAPQECTFVEYLRDALLRWGGFPGWAQAGGTVPDEIAELRSGLVEF